MARADTGHRRVGSFPMMTTPPGAIRVTAIEGQD